MNKKRRLTALFLGICMSVASISMPVSVRAEEGQMQDSTDSSSTIKDTDQQETEMQMDEEQVDSKVGTEEVQNQEQSNNSELGDESSEVQGDDNNTETDQLIDNANVDDGSILEENQAQQDEAVPPEQQGQKANSWRYRDGELLTTPEYRSRASSYPNAWEKVNGVYMNSAGQPIKGAVKKGIDVSYAQGVINWEKVKADGISFAIIQCGFGDDYKNQDDKMWEYNVSECERLGIPYGVYLYSYATNVTMAKSEAKHALRLLRGHNPSYPVYFDMEDDTTVNLSSELKGQIAKVFCDTIMASGYKVGIYANLDWWSTQLTSSVFSNPSWSKWVAQYNTTCDYAGKYDIWQCTSAGKVDGIDGNVDVNFLMSHDLPYKDVNVDSWYYDAVSYMYESGYMTGLASDKFGPSAQISRAQFTTILYRMSGSPQIGYSATFPDVPNGQFYTSAVLWANKVGVITGYKNTGNFGPSDFITREQMATILYRYAKYCGYDTSQRGDLSKYSDRGKVAPFAQDAMRWAVGVGIISGNANGTLAPRNPADRAATAVMMMRYETVLKY